MGARITMVLKINYLLIKEKIKNMITCQFIWYVRKSLVKMKERKRKHFSICVREFIWFFKIKIPFLVLLFNFILVKKKTPQILNLVSSVLVYYYYYF